MTYKRVKSLLHLGAMSAIQHCAQFKAYYTRKVAKGKNKMLVLNNIRNKLVLRVFACVRVVRNYKENLSFPFSSIKEINYLFIKKTGVSQVCLVII